MKHWLFVVLTTLTLIGATANAETFYKWEDAAGVTHYGERPPEGIDGVPVNTMRGPSPVKKAPAEPVVEETQAEFDQRLEEANAERKEQMATACEAARDARVEFEAKHRVRLKQDDGTFKMLSHEEKLAEMKKLDQRIEEYCNP